MQREVQEEQEACKGLNEHEDLDEQEAYEGQSIRVAEHTMGRTDTRGERSKTSERGKTTARHTRELFTSSPPVGLADPVACPPLLAHRPVPIAPIA